MKVTQITKLPEVLHELRKDVTQLFELVQGLNHKTLTNEEEIGKAHANLKVAEAEFRNNTSTIMSELESLRLRNTELEHIITRLKQSQKSTGTAAPASSSNSKELFAENHDLDTFYLEFENHFRGDEAEIRRKQEPYVQVFVENSPDKSLPVADLGCGRGEFLQLLEDNGLQGLGVDMNDAMVTRAQEKGFKAVNNDAISFLLNQESNSLSGVTGFHLAEHIPFDQLLILMAEAYRCLTKGGILLLETPNPESLFVGAFTFHYDPSHLKPLPPAIMQFSARFKGFEKAEIMRLQPELTEKEIAGVTKNAQLQDALKRLYGPRDYALVAYK